MTTLPFLSLPILHGQGGLAFALGLVAVALVVPRLRDALRPRRWPVRGRPRIMTDTELRFYRTLTRAVPDLTVFCQVSVLQLIELEGQGTKRYWMLFRRLGPMSVDYVLCRPDGRIVACVELDDATHSLPRRILADAAKDRAFRDAGLLLLRIPVNQMPGVAELADALRLVHA